MIKGDLLNIPNNLLLNLNLLNRFEVSSPIETNKGYLLIYLYNYQNKMIPNLDNSWNLIYNYSKQKKQAVFFENWINNIKNKIYIKLIN